MKSTILLLILSAFQGGSMTPTGKGSYPVMIDYDKEDFDARRKAVKFEWCDPTVTADRFGTKKSGTVAADLRLIAFDSQILTTKEALAEIKRLGLRPGSADELLAFARGYPYLVEKFPVVALGSVYRRPGEPGLVLITHLSAGRRILDVEYDNGEWSMEVRFLAVKDPPQPKTRP